MTDPIQAALDNDQPTAVPRPLGQLHDLPAPMRWEVTRRHPYYLVFWDDSRLYHQGELGEREQAVFRYAAALMLGTIGVFGEPVSPGTDFADLTGGELDPAFLSGSVQPMSLRSVAAILINALPPAERAVLGSILMTSGNGEYAIAGDDAARTSQKLQAMCRLAQIPSKALDSFPDAPLFYIHPGASLRTIEHDLRDQVQRWKQRLGKTERRVHVKKLPEYLRVWDLREGWTGAGYQRSREQTLTKIAQQLGIPLSTVASQYKSAYQMITGHAFTPSLWRRLLGPLKFSEVLGDPREILSAPTRRRLRSPVRRPVPDSVVSPLTDQPHFSGTVERESAVSSEIDGVDMFLDMEDCIRRGLSDDEIAHRLDLATPEIAAYWRERLDEFAGI